MRRSPARIAAPEPDSWIPIESLESLPELEELLDPKYLVDSGQSRAVKIGDDGTGYVLIDSEVKSALEFEHKAKVELSQRRWLSKHRSIRMKQRAKYQRIIGLIVVAALALLSAFGIYKYFVAPVDQVAFSTKPMVPVRVPIIVEGEKRTVLSVADSMKELIDEQSLGNVVPIQKTFKYDQYSSSGTDELLEFRYEKNVQLNVDSTSSTVKSTDLTVQDFLQSNNIVIDSDDIVTPPRQTPLNGVTNVDVQRVSSSTRTQDVAIPFKVINQNDSSLTKGKTKIQRTGINGSQTLTYTQTIHEGKVASEVISSRVTTKSPVDQIVLVGTKNPVSQSGKATFYGAPSGTCAHKTLPMGTIVTITNVSTGASTTCKVADRGPFAQGRVIDLSKDTFSQIASLSQGVVTVNLSW